MNTHMPKAIFIAGLPGSGKSWFARLLARETGAVHLNTDILRNRLGNRGKYDLDTKMHVYEVMNLEMGELLSQGLTVIVDATFYKENIRKAFEENARLYCDQIFFIYLHAAEEIIRERVSQPRPDSDADFDVYRQIKSLYEPFRQPCLSLDSGVLSGEQMLEQALTYCG